MHRITIGSLFDGSGGFPLAGCMCGMEPLWASEVEPYPIAVTKARFPRMKHLGDVQKISGAEIDPVDVITFGSPCQDMSIAGKRAGLRHEENGDDRTTRSGLFIEAIRIIREMRQATNGKYPAFAVWENVPGAFSSNGGADFKTVLEEFASVAQGERVSVPFPEKRRWLNAGEIVGDGYSVAWRTLDAQYWGVPQRRKRIYLVADFAGGRAGEILFEREGVRGDTAPSGAPWKETAADATGSAGGSNCLRCLNPWDCQSKRIYQPEGIYPTLPAMECSGANNQAVIYSLQGNGIDRADTAGCNGCGWREDVCYTLNTIDHPAICFKAGQGAKARSMGESEKVAPTLGSEAGGNSVPAVCYDARGIGDGAHAPTLTGDHENRVTDYMAVTVYRHTKIGEYAADGTASTMVARDFKSPRDLFVKHPPAYGIDCRNDVLDEEKTHTLQAKANGGQSLNCTPSVLTSGRPPRKYIICRLTPLECCRLQGFPDGWGDIPRLETMSDADAKFWEDVRRIYAGVMGKKYRPFKDRDALVKWYNKLHTDSAEYKMWGNGIALPCAVFVMHGIAECVSAME